MLDGQIFECVIAPAEFVCGVAGLTAHDCVLGFGCPVFTVVLVPEGSHVVRTGQIAVVVTGKTGLGRVLMRLGAGKGVGQCIAVQGHLVGRGAEFDLPRFRNHLQEFVHQRLAVCVVLEIIGIIPFSPAADESGLDYHDDIIILLNQGSELINVFVNLLGSSIPGLCAHRIAVGIAEAEDAFHTALPKRLKIGADGLEVGLVDVRRHVIREMEFQQKERTSLHSGGSHAGVRDASAVSLVNLVSDIETPFRIGKILIGRLVGDGNRLGFRFGSRRDRCRVRVLATSESQRKDCGNEGDSGDSFHGVFF